MLNKATITTLAEINKFTNSVVLKYPYTIANSPSNDIMLQLDVSQLDAESFPDIGLFNNLSEFLSNFALYSDDRVVTVEDNVIAIKDGNYSGRYITNKISLLRDYDKPKSIFDTTLATNTVCTFELGTELISKIKQASKTFTDLNDVLITSKDGETTVSLTATNKFNAQANTFNIIVPSQTTKEFSIAIPVENMSLLPNTPYQAEVKFNEQKGAYRFLLQSTEVNGLLVMLSTNSL